MHTSQIRKTRPLIQQTSGIRCFHPASIFGDTPAREHMQAVAAKTSVDRVNPMEIAPVHYHLDN